MDDLTLKTFGGADIYLYIDRDGDLVLETERNDETVVVYVAAAGLQQLRDWLNKKLPASAGAEHG